MHIHLFKKNLSLGNFCQSSVVLLVYTGYVTVIIHTCITGSIPKLLSDVDRRTRPLNKKKICATLLYTSDSINVWHLMVKEE